MSLLNQEQKLAVKKKLFSNETKFLLMLSVCACVCVYTHTVDINKRGSRDQDDGQNDDSSVDRATGTFQFFGQKTFEPLRVCCVQKPLHFFLLLPSCPCSLLRSFLTYIIPFLSYLDIASCPIIILITSSS